LTSSVVSRRGAPPVAATDPQRPLTTEDDPAIGRPRATGVEIDVIRYDIRQRVFHRDPFQNAVGGGKCQRAAVRREHRVDDGFCTANRLGVEPIELPDVDLSRPVADRNKRHTRAVGRDGYSRSSG
jgi:hypothetical protein